VLDEEKCAAGLQHAPGFGQRPSGVRDGAEHRDGHDPVYESSSNGSSSADSRTKRTGRPDYAARRSPRTRIPSFGSRATISVTESE
jgi:hypothetical protein